MSRTSVASARPLSKLPQAARLTFEDVGHALQDLADLVLDLADLAVGHGRGGVEIRNGTLLHIGDAIRDLSERCHARHEDGEA